MRVIGLGGALALLATGAAAGPWFQHEYGEMRSYHGDWMAVCAKAGEGACRIVATAKDPGSSAFFDLRLAAHRIDGSPYWAIEVMDRNMPASTLTSLTFDFDGDKVSIPVGAWVQGDFDGYNAVDTVVIRDGDLATGLVDRMIAGRRVIVTYEPHGEGDGRAEFSLRGVASASNAVQAIVLPRQE